MVLNDKRGLYLRVFYAFMTYFFLIFLYISGLHSSSESFIKLSQISTKFSNTFTGKNLRISGPTQFKSMLPKGQLYFDVQCFTDLLIQKLNQNSSFPRKAQFEI